MNRINIIQSFIDKIGAKSYLEIGVQGGSCFEAIKCDNKIGVDPDKSSRANVHKTSDDFFAGNPDKFDVIFIDGLHHADQVEKDIINALDRLNEGGIIVCHDMLPTTKSMQEIPLRPDHCEWTGDCYKAWVKLRQERNDLEMYVVDTDWGCGVIKRGGQEPVKIDIAVNFDNYFVHKKEWANVISVDEFKQKEGF